MDKWFNYFNQPIVIIIILLFINYSGQFIKWKIGFAIFSHIWKCDMLFLNINNAMNYIVYFKYSHGNECANNSTSLCFLYVSPTMKRNIIQTK